VPTNQQTALGSAMFYMFFEGKCVDTRFDAFKSLAQ